MEIKVDTDLINESVNNALQKAATESIMEYDFRTKLQETVRASLVSGGLFEEVENQIAADIAEQAKPMALAVAKEIVKASARAVVICYRESIVQTVFNLRHGSNYLTKEDKQKAIDKISFELFGKKYDLKDDELPF